MCKIQGLPIKELDPRCREFIYFLNKYGFTTKFCCEGHPGGSCNTAFYIMFEDTIPDELIDKLIFIVGNRGEFRKWKRMIREYGQPRILTNWSWSFNYGTAEENHMYANVACRLFKKHFNEKYTRTKYCLII